MLASSLSVNKAKVLQAICSFSAGSSGGPDGFRPQHLLDLVSCRESGADLLTSLTSFTNLLLQGKCHLDVTPVLFGERLVALNPKGIVRYLYIPRGQMKAVLSLFSGATTVRFWATLYTAWCDTLVCM